MKCFRSSDIKFDTIVRLSLLSTKCVSFSKRNLSRFVHFRFLLITNCDTEKKKVPYKTHVLNPFDLLHRPYFQTCVHVCACVLIFQTMFIVCVMNIHSNETEKLWLHFRKCPKNQFFNSLNWITSISISDKIPRRRSSNKRFKGCQSSSDKRKKMWADSPEKLTAHNWEIDIEWKKRKEKEYQNGRRKKERAEKTNAQENC